MCGVLERIQAEGGFEAGPAQFGHASTEDLHFVGNDFEWLGNIPYVVVVLDGQTHPEQRNPPTLPVNGRVAAYSCLRQSAQRPRRCRFCWRQT